MKQELSPEHRKALTRYRLERAHKTLEEAIYCGMEAISMRLSTDSIMRVFMRLQDY